MAVKVELLTIPGCVECEKFKRFWQEEKQHWPTIDYQEIDGLSPEGQEIIQRFQIMASPGLIINGELFAVGGVDQKKFLEKLQSLKTTP